MVIPKPGQPFLASSKVSQINSGLLQLLLQMWICHTHCIHVESPHRDLNLVFQSFPPTHYVPNLYFLPR